MRKITLFLLMIALSSVSLFAQSWQSGTGKLYTNPSTTKVGIGLTNPQYTLEVNGKIRLRTIDEAKGWGQSYLYWQRHSLVMGTPPGEYAHNTIELKPGGYDNSPEPLLSRIRMYSAITTTNHIQKVEINTEGNCWFKTLGNFGIGTSNPQYKLDVLGTIRAREVIVNTDGADFVFDNNYKLRPLEDVSNFISLYKHLPDVQSALEMRENGVSVSELQTVLLQKVEELTLYIIQQNTQIKSLQEEINQLKIIGK